MRISVIEKITVTDSDFCDVTKVFYDNEYDYVVINKSHFSIASWSCLFTFYVSCRLYCLLKLSYCGIITEPLIIA